MAETKNSEYVLYYWPPSIAGAGRGAYVRLLFEAAGVSFSEVNDADLLVKWFKEQEIEGYPCFAPPMLRHGDLQISQTPVICRYLAKQFGFLPDSEVDQWHAEQINITIHDYIADARLAFHGKDFQASYYVQVEETKPYTERFTKNRLPKFLGHFEKILAQNAGGKSFIVGDKLTYVDLAMVHALRATEANFQESWATMSASTAPLLKAYKARIEDHPRLQEYYKSDRVIPFCGNSMM